MLTEATLARQLSSTPPTGGCGDTSLEELVESTERSVLLGRIWYAYPVNPITADFSATNRGTTFYIEDRRVKFPILPNSFRISRNI